MYFSDLQQLTLYDRILKKTIVIIMRDFKIIPETMGKIDKDYVKVMKTDNICLTNLVCDGTITHGNRKKKSKKVRGNTVELA